MATNSSWIELIERVDAEIALVERLVQHGQAAESILSGLDTSRVEDWVSTQRELLAGLDAAARHRERAVEACYAAPSFPNAARPASGAASLAALSLAAPGEHAAALRGRRGRLLKLRRDHQRAAVRNRTMVETVLWFTGQLGRDLAQVDRRERYDTLGRAVHDAGAGVLFNRSV